MSYQRISFDYVDVPPLHSGVFGRIATALKRWREQVAQRETLARFDARMLQDIGITASDVWRETRNHRRFG